MNWTAASVSKSLLPLVALTMIAAIGLVFLGLHGFHKPEPTLLLYDLEFRLLLACWVLFDRRARRISLPYEFDAFVFIAPIVLPWYLYRTRGRRGLLLFAGIFGLFVAPESIAVIIYGARLP